MEKKKKIIINVIIIVSILVISLTALFIVEATRKPGAAVLVKIDGKEVATYSLDKDATYELNGGTNILRIEGGKAWMIEANCPGHDCIKQGKISKTGKYIACLPNKILVIVVGEDDFVELE